jgi:hypothetical protein
LFVPVDFSFKVFVKIFKNGIHRSYILTVKKSVTQSETCPETILNYKRSPLNEHGLISVVLVEPAKLRKHG